jgi:hypothetical protein
MAASSLNFGVGFSEQECFTGMTGDGYGACGGTKSSVLTLITDIRIIKHYILIRPRRGTERAEYLACGHG